MPFTPDFLDQIRARVPLPEVIGRHVKLIKRGREWVGLCPFHSEKTPSFTVSESKGFYHCFGCGAHGDVIGFVSRREGLSFPDAVERLAAQAGLALPPSSPQDQAESRRRADLHEVLELATAWFEQQMRTEVGRRARAYLEWRGLAATTVAGFRLGYAPDRRGVLRATLNAKGIRDDMLAESGLIKRPEDGGEPRDYFFDRIIFPITDRMGRTIAFGGRALGESRAKYLNSPDTPLFHKGRVLYNLARARHAAHETGEIVVAEGYMDVIALAESGIPAAVAPLGTAITEEQIGELWRLVPEPVLCLDGDAAGRRAGIRAAQRALPLLRPGHSLRFVRLPAGEDPDSFARNHGAEALREELKSARSLIDQFWLNETEGKNFDTPERRVGLRQRLLEAVRQIRDPVVQKAYEQEIVTRWEAIFGFSASRERVAARRERHRGKPARWRSATMAGLGATPPPKRLRPRQEQALLGGLINHPSLLAEHAEELAALTFQSTDLDRLRRELLDLAAMEQALDTTRVKRHLCQQGFDRALNALLSEDVYVLAPFARPAASIDLVEEGWRHALDLYRNAKSAKEGPSVRDLDEARSLKGKRQLVQDGEISRVGLDRVGATHGEKPG